MLHTLDLWILGFSAMTVALTIWMGFWAARKSRTASDFFVAGRGVSVGWNASAISGEYLSAASFMGIAGMVMSSGYDALWYPVCYACGYLFLLLFIAGPLRRFGAYTIPDFAEGRYDSPLFRKIAVIFVLFIGFVYTMPQMKGAGTTLAYVLPGLPYWAGVVIVGTVITLNVALGGMKGITLVQAFQYWLKLFAISVPIFVLMSVYGSYGGHLGANRSRPSPSTGISGVQSDRSSPTAPLSQGRDVGSEQGGRAAATEAGTDPRPPARLSRRDLPATAPADDLWLNPFGPLTSKAAKVAGLSAGDSRFYALIYTYSLIIALVCGTAGLPHILVRFYTNPNGIAAKRTTMGVMILIGVFYVFPPVFGVMGRNVLPELYAGKGAKGTDKVVLELPRILTSDASASQQAEMAASLGGPLPSSRGSTAGNSANSKAGMPWGSILSGITCAGAFAAFMSTFSGLLVSMTGAMAHDVYGRILRPRSTAAERMRMFKIVAWLMGALATALGCFVEPLQINFMVGQAFAIAAASYFPLLFMSVWWRGMTMRGAATGMLAGGISAVTAVTLTNFSDLGWLPIKGYWAGHPLARILCEQPAIWSVPMAIGLMVVISLLNRRNMPADIRMKMLVLHAPEMLGLKQEYIREHETDPTPR